MAFPYAYRNGADFVIAGMFDFQVEADVKIAIDGLKKARQPQAALAGLTRRGTKEAPCSTPRKPPRWPRPWRRPPCG